ncbi:MAG: hypothetical protein R3Y28_05500 [Candidatus Gastranaerophilales bacterium]
MGYPYQNQVQYQRQIKRRETGMANIPIMYSAPPVEKIEIAPDLLDSISAEAFKSQALGNILTKNPLKFGMSISEYGASLMKQGKIPEKDFVVLDNSLIEINKRGNAFKKTTFYEATDTSPAAIESTHYNSVTQEKAKTIRYTEEGMQTTHHLE